MHNQIQQLVFLEQFFLNSSRKRNSIAFSAQHTLKKNPTLPSQQNNVLKRKLKEVFIIYKHKMFSF